MARDNKDLAGFSFDDVAEPIKASELTPVNKELAPNNMHVNVDVMDKAKSRSVEVATDYLDNVMGQKKKLRLDELTSTGIYFDNDVYQVLMRLAKKGGRGAKSKIVNEAVRGVFKEKGLL